MARVRISVRDRDCLRVRLGLLLWLRLGLDIEKV
jgi:hypothetical protein